MVIHHGILVMLQVFQKRLPPEAVDLVCRFFQYSPNLRCTAVSKSFSVLFPLVYISIQTSYIYVLVLQLEACIHPFFDELRDPNTRLPNGRPLPPLFNFKTQGEFELASIAINMSSW